MQISINEKSMFCIYRWEMIEILNVTEQNILSKKSSRNYVMICEIWEG